VAVTQNEALKLRDLKGKNLVLYFYPKDHTPGCTTQGHKHEFPFDLISDPDEILCKAMDVMKEKSMYGKKYIGIERSTFVFDTKGKLVHEVRKVKVKGHVDAILEVVMAI